MLASPPRLAIWSASIDWTPGSPRRPSPSAPGDLGGEQKRVTILIAEVAGLTESVHSFEPDLADRLQTSIVPLLVDVVHHCGGTVSRVGGDTLMAIFGAPLAREDDTVRAC